MQAHLRALGKKKKSVRLVFSAGKKLAVWEIAPTCVTKGSVLRLGTEHGKVLRGLFPCTFWSTASACVVHPEQWLEGLPTYTYAQGVSCEIMYYHCT